MLAVQELLASFLSATGARFSRAWDPNATHLIVGTDAKGVARRTLNFLFATLAGIWVLKADCESLGLFGTLCILRFGVSSYEFCLQG